MDSGTGGGGFREQGMEVAKLFLEFAQLLAVSGRSGALDGKRKLRFLLAELALDDLAGAGDGVALVVEKGLDVEGGLYIAAAIETLAGAAFVRLELGKLALPEAEDVGGNVAEF